MARVSENNGSGKITEDGDGLGITKDGKRNTHKNNTSSRIWINGRISKILGILGRYIST